MNLKTQKMVAKVAGAALVVGGAGYGVTKLFSHSSAPAAPTPVTVNAPKNAPVAQAPVQIPAPAPIKRGDNADEKAAKLAMLTSADQQLLQSRGFTVQNQQGSFGRDCNSNGTTDGSGWHGVGTSLSYKVSRSGQTGDICVAHSGKNGVNAQVSGFNATSGVIVQPPVSQAPQVAPSAPSQAKAILSGMDVEKKQKVLAMQTLDLGILRSQGLKVHDFKGQMGRACNSDGSTDGQGFKGTGSSISYLVSRNGQMGQICLTHGGKIDSLKAQLGSPFVPQ